MGEFWNAKKLSMGGGAILFWSSACKPAYVLWYIAKTKLVKSYTQYTVAVDSLQNKMETFPICPF